MEKILGLDLGTNSIGWALRNDANNENQIEKFGVLTFEKGVGLGKSGEYSYAAERTKNRSLRRLYQARKYKLWNILDLLIDEGFCPLSKENLFKWSHYNKAEAHKGKGGRQYPIDDAEFNNWIKLDFNNDGKPDFISPYQLRYELVNAKLDLSDKENKFKIGRALYHIAQHRGFKSSKKAQNKDDKNNEGTVDLIGAEKKRAGVIIELLQKYNAKTVGAAFAKEEEKGNRIRKDIHQYVLRKQLQEEVKEIFLFQGMPVEENLFKKITKAIFWQRPLRSQKGTIGKCTLEPKKYRCSVSHPAFEEFRALSFINNIEYKIKNEKEAKWLKISNDFKREIFIKLFFRVSKADFDFSEIRKFIEQKNKHQEWEFNYKDKTNVSACPVSARLKDIFGENWNQIQILKNKKGTEYKKYFYEDIWHVLFTYDDKDLLEEFGKEKLKLTDEQNKKFSNLWLKEMPVGYGMLSINAINNILPFLREGLIYTEAVLLAKVPEVLGSNWNENSKLIKESISTIISENRKEKKLLSITNNLIAKYKALDHTEKFAFKDFTYKLDDADKREIIVACEEYYGEKTWEKTDEEDKNKIVSKVTKEYQTFFADSERAFKKMPHLLQSMKKFLIEKFEFLQCKIEHNTEEEKKNCKCKACKLLRKLYHPSQINIYPPAKEKYYKEIERTLVLLDSPKTGAFKNPMAMRTLYELRKFINYLITTDQIDEETRIVVEVARELNDANKRWAIKTYQNRRQEENKEFAEAINELIKEIPSAKADPNSSDDIDKFRLWYEMIEQPLGIADKSGNFIENILEIKSRKGKDGEEHEYEEFKEKNFDRINTALYFKLKKGKENIVDKYRLWKEQQSKCIYTGRSIGIADLFSEGNTDFEHTIPRSISFDNSLANLTVCDSNYNRNIKGKLLPTELPNYEKNCVINGKEYTAIKPRLEAWNKKVEELKIHIEFWKKKSKWAPDKEQKDKAIRQRHLWQMELDYWQNKLNRFTLKEVNSGFKNSQLVDTQIISKYAFHFLKTLFHKVEVQKGSVTAEFRKIYGLQPKDELKDRSRHSHHAKDAAVLALIPVSSKRDEILKKSFEHFEANRQQYHEKPYNNFSTSIIEKIDDIILINNIAKDQALTPGKKRVRIRGKKVFLQNNETGALKLDENGNHIEKWAKGDSIRGQIHLDTFYGKIRPAKLDENNKPIRDNDGNWVFNEKKDGYLFVIRKDVNKDLDVEKIVDPGVKKCFKNQMKERTIEKTLKEDGGIFMLNKKGEQIHRIRHVRIIANSTELLPIKRQTNLSIHEYKQNYWADNGENYVYALYQDEKGNKGFEMLNLFNAAKIQKEISINAIEDFFPKTKLVGRTKKEGKLIAVLKPNLKVIFYQNSIEDLKYLSQSDLVKRLYKIISLYGKTDGRIQFQHHLEAKQDKELSVGASKINFYKPESRLLLSPLNFNFAVEGKDFEIKPDGNIKWK